MATSRRQFLALSAGAAGLGLAGLAGHEWPWSSGDGAAASANPDQGPAAATVEYNANQTHFFYSRPDLHPPRATVVGRSSGASGPVPPDELLLLTPKAFLPPGPGEPGVMLIQSNGRLRWFRPTGEVAFDLQYQQFKGKPVLTWWEGKVTNGTGAGEAVVADLNFNEITRIGELDGLRPDLHELNLTDRGTALITAYHPVPADLRSVGGPKDGYLMGAVAMEVDVATKKLLHRWESVDHVKLDETYQELPKGQGTKEVPFDYFHINSISLTPDGELLISSRDMWALYKVNRTSGDVIWRLNGKKSDFQMGEGARFYWQHHSRYHGATTISLFDDGAAPAEEPQSRGIVLHVDEDKMTVTLEKSFVHPLRILTPHQGSIQLMPDGGAWIGWGAQPYFSRFSSDGELVVDGRLPSNVESYRAFSADLVGRPDNRPAVAIFDNPVGGKIVYVSWNGSTEVVSWEVLSGPAGKLAPVALADWADFETAVTVNGTGPYFQVIALDAAGRKIGSSEVLAA